MHIADGYPKGRRPDGSGDRRWVIITKDGRLSTLGRASDPTEQEIAQVENRLLADGLCGWLAIISGSAYATQRPEILLVRSLAGADPAGLKDAEELLFSRSRIAS